MGVAALVAIDADGNASVETSSLATNGLMLHLVAYAVTNMAVFMAIAAVYNATGKEAISDFAGLAQRAPMVAMVLAVAFFSLAGLPIFAGFTSKFYLFTAAATQGLLWLAGLAIVTSLISLYYYLVVVRQMYIETAEDPTPISVPWLTTAALGVLFAGIVLLGVYPAPLMEAIQAASDVPAFFRWRAAARSCCGLTAYLPTCLPEPAPGHASPSTALRIPHLVSSSTRLRPR